MTKVRSAIATILALALLLAIAAPALARQGPEGRVTVAMLPRGTTPSMIADASGAIAPGILSAGLGSVPANQTYLDISQGNRLFDSLYPDPIQPLPLRAGGVAPGPWELELRRAAGAPAQIEPGLLAQTLGAAGIPITATPAARQAALIALHPDGSIDRARGCRLGSCPGVTVGSAEISDLPDLVAGLGEDDLLIALERPPPADDLASIGIAGAGFDGTLRSPTTRIDGYVLSTDLAATILSHYGLEAPSAISGRPIDSTGVRDLPGLTATADRLGEIAPRRHPVVGVNLLLWLGLVAAVSLAWRGRVAALALSALAVTFAWVPALLLLTAAIEPGLVLERLVVGVGAPVLGLGSIGLLYGRFGPRSGFAAFALAAAVSVCGTGVDVVAGSGLTSLSLIGPNPALGVRFFGIGNELEAVIGVLLALGAGAAVAAIKPTDPGRAVTAAAVCSALVAVVIFAPGRWGADVGAAITFTAGAGGVAIAALGRSRTRLAAIVAAPIAAVAALIAIDLAIGGDAHLSRSVLNAGGLDELGQVVERRVRLSARSFGRFFDSFFFAAALVLIVVAVGARRRILGWFARLPAARAGLAGAITAAVVGSLANDSGALLLVVGSAYTGAYVGLGWAAPRLGAQAAGR